MREIIARGGTFPAVAVVEDGKLVEYIEDEGQATADTLFLGKVVRVVPGLQAAFVDIGETKNGFLPLHEKSLSGNARYMGISENLQSGDRVLVQIRREAIGEKGAFLSRDISLAGSFVMYMPRNNMIGVSSRIVSESRREKLKELGRTISEERFGLVMRTSSENASESEIRSEVSELAERWKAIQAAAATAHAPSVICGKNGSVDALITDYLPKGIDAVITDRQQVYDDYHAGIHVQFVQEDPIAARALDAECMRALDRRVWLKSGGNLIIDECEALTVIDVNTAKSTGSGSDRKVLLKTNLEACREIARQIRLRNLGGIVLIDMIDMDRDEERTLILDELKKALALDRVKTVIHGFTSLGLIEMTRRRSHRRLRDLYAEVCPRCSGAGYIRKNHDDRCACVKPVHEQARPQGGETAACPKEAEN